ncbi:MAG: NADP-dependent malic enzyme [Patescibacteria group bacterium]|nr:NADP-dependent malic enzyme [Patescibacteria group bacterium]
MNPLSLSKNGKLNITSKIKLTSKNISSIYTPGIADVVAEITKDRSKVYDLTWKGRTVAIVSDGSAILGLGNRGPEAALPVMEAKAVLFRELGGINAIPLVIDTQNENEIIKFVKMISPGFGGINLEDISAPRCFTIEEKLKKSLNIPVFHDDQHGTAIVVLAGLLNAAKVVRKNLKKCSVVISGAGAAGIAITSLLLRYGLNNIVVFDSRGPLYERRKAQMNFAKKKIASHTNLKNFRGTLHEALKGTDIFIGVSAPNIIGSSDVKQMSRKPIVFALANPCPEIMSGEAKKGGAAVIATGRSDLGNQINNALVFPGIFKGALLSRTVLITDEIKIKAAQALSAIVKNPAPARIIPGVMDKRAVNVMANIFKRPHAKPR